MRRFPLNWDNLSRFYAFFTTFCNHIRSHDFFAEMKNDLDLDQNWSKSSSRDGKVRSKFVSGSQKLWKIYSKMKFRKTRNKPATQIVHVQRNINSSFIKIKGSQHLKRYFFYVLGVWWNLAKKISLWMASLPSRFVSSSDHFFFKSDYPEFW